MRYAPTPTRAPTHPLVGPSIYIYRACKFFGFLVTYPVIMNVGAPKKYDIEFFKKLYTTGNYTLRGICKEFGPSYSHISNISARDKWGDSKREYQRAALEADESAKEQREQEEMVELKNAELSTATEHQDRVIRTGDRLGDLINTGILAVKSSNWRDLKQVVETWKLWDDQMRKNHRIEEKNDKPIVNINVLAALPSLKQKVEEAEAVETETT